MLIPVDVSGEIKILSESACSEPKRGMMHPRFRQPTWSVSVAELSPSSSADLAKSELAFGGQLCMATSCGVGRD